MEGLKLDGSLKDMRHPQTWEWVNFHCQTPAIVRRQPSWMERLISFVNLGVMLEAVALRILVDMLSLPFNLKTPKEIKA